MDLLWLLLLILEICGGIYLDRKLWRSVLSPFFFLSVPFLAVLVFTIFIAGKRGIIEFYYPSLLPWVIGLPLFSISSFFTYRLLVKTRFVSDGKFLCGGIQRYLVVGKYIPGASLDRELLQVLVLSIIALVPLFIRLFILLQNPVEGCNPGGDCFSTRLIGKGLIAHWGVFTMALVVFQVYLLENPFRKVQKNRWMVLSLWALFLLTIGLLLLQQVKSWIILPVLTGLLARFLSRKGEFRFIYLVYIVIGGFLLFVASYLLIHYFGSSFFPEAHTLKEQLQSVVVMFVHYISSGILGLSADMQAGIVEQHDLSYILTPFYNVWYLIQGEPLISTHNPEFLYIGLRLTNIRTFFGTLYVFCPPLVFILITLVVGMIGYTFYFFFLFRRNLCATFLYSWIACVLFFGWFDYYFQILNTMEIPFWILIVFGIMQIHGRMTGRLNVKSNN